jgi:exopolysaccharide production protein ExoZ
MEREKQSGIQIARAIAALSIVYYHSWVSITRFPKDTAFPIPFLSSYGWLGVDFFFAISGFVICLVASRGTFAVRPFLIKRVFRLYPLWLLMLTLFALTAWLWRGLQPEETFLFYLRSASLMLTNGFPFYSIGWSLQHEMVFYLAATIIIPLAGISGLAAVLFASYLAFQTFDMPWYVATLANHHGEFFAGTLAFMLRDRMRPLGFLLPVIVGVLMVSYFAMVEKSQLLPFGLFFLIAGFANLTSPSLPRTQAAMELVGDASYSMYLIHPMVFMIVSAIVSKLSWLPVWSEEPIRWGSILLVIPLSILSWKYFERPVIALGNSIAAEVPRKVQPIEP